MTSGSDSSTFCSDLAFAEGLGGTAPTATAWVIFEYAGPWSREAVSPETFAMDPLGAEFLRTAEILESLGAKVLLAREPGAAHIPLARDSRVWIAQEPEYVPHLSSIGEVMNGVGQFDGENLAELLNGVTAASEDGPHLFICCHGKRDQCCAVKGRALVRELESTRTFVWECSHLGGHRFAPTALLLPHGGVFGRLSHTSINSILDGSSLGLEQLRGLSSLSSEQQVIDLAAKELWQLPWSAKLRIDRIDVEGHKSSFIATAPDERGIRCTVSRSIQNLPVSCGKPASETTVWQVVELREE